jgi:hypothetical protein
MAAREDPVSLRDVALGAAAIGVRGAGRAAAILTFPSRAAWALGPARVVNPLLAGLADRGRREQRQLRERAGATAQDLAVAILDSPELAQLLDSPSLERVLERVLDSRLADEMTDRVLASDELQRVVSHIAQSDEVRTALTQQSAGLANEVADQVRSRTVAADDVAERFARRILRRRRERGEPEPDAR